jgi:cytochrome c oxidase assembly protein subunit 15
VNNRSDNPWFSRFAWLTAITTWLLIGLGGLVTSKGVGMAVPDWPTSYGYNMFLFPISQWVGGIFYEHTHRLLASLVGVLTAILTAWVWIRESAGWPRRCALAFIICGLGLMGVRTQGMFIAMAIAAAIGVILCVSRAVSAGRPLRWWVGVAFCGVIVQGVLGGLRVTAMADGIGIFHGTLAQLFLVLITLIALSTGRMWARIRERTGSHSMPSSVRLLLVVTTLAILGQLMLGAGMRHQHAGLAVPDFPAAYGGIYPATDPESIARYNSQRIDHREPNEIRPLDIHLHMAHRANALILVFLVPFAAVRLKRALDGRLPGVAFLANVWIALLAVQVVLGIVTVLKDKPADIATLHVMVGALCLGAGAVLVRVSHEFSVAAQKSVMQSPARPNAGSSTGAPEQALS